jgi:translation initiation factor 4A
MSDRFTQALILVPTHEQAQVIEKGILAIGKHMKVVCHSSVGGTTNIRQDVASVGQGVHVLVGTVGRVTDLINRRALRTDNIRMICLHGADKLLSLGFRKGVTGKVLDGALDGCEWSLILCADHDIYLCELVLKLFSQNTQFIFMSVSMAADIVKTAKDLSHDPSRFLTIGEKSASITPIFVRQFYVAVQKEGMKVDRLSELFEVVNFNQAIIFCNTRHQVDW